MRQPTMSPTKFATFLACPYKYKWLYLDSRGKWFVRSKSCYSFGTSLHRVLQRYHDNEDISIKSLDDAVEALDQAWIDAGYASAAEMSEALGDGKIVIQRYIRAAEHRQKESQTIFVEKQLSHSYDEFKLLGRVDRIEEYPDGELEVVDYKSGRETVSSEDVASDISMGCYQLLMRKNFPGRKVTATIIALRSGHQASYSMNEIELNEFEKDILKLGTIILSEDFQELFPKRKRICTDCDFVPLCKKYSEFLDQELLASSDDFRG